MRSRAVNSIAKNVSSFFIQLYKEVDSFLTTTPVDQEPVLESKEIAIVREIERERFQAEEYKRVRQQFHNVLTEIEETDMPLLEGDIPALEEVDIDESVVVIHTYDYQPQVIQDLIPEEKAQDESKVESQDKYLGYSLIDCINQTRIIEEAFHKIRYKDPAFYQLLIESAITNGLIIDEDNKIVLCQMKFDKSDREYCDYFLIEQDLGTIATGKPKALIQAERGQFLCNTDYHQRVITWGMSFAFAVSVLDGILSQTKTKEKIPEAKEVVVSSNRLGFFTHSHDHVLNVTEPVTAADWQPLSPTLRPSRLDEPD